MISIDLFLEPHFSVKGIARTGWSSKDFFPRPPLNGRSVEEARIGDVKTEAEGGRFLGGETLHGDGVVSNKKGVLRRGFFQH